MAEPQERRGSLEYIPADQDAQADPEPEEVQQRPDSEPEEEVQPDPEPEPVQEPVVEPEPEQKVEDAPVEVEQVEAYGGDLPASIDAGCTNLYSDNPGFNWMTTICTDAGKGAKALEIHAVGTGGLNELKEKMAECAGDIIFFQLRVDTYDDSGSKRAKFIYGRFVGTKVKFMQKAKLTTNLGAIADMFQVKHLSKDCDENMKDWDPETLGKEFLKIGGAHKPDKYVFGPNAVFINKK